MDQIVHQIVAACAMGALAPEERLPPAAEAARQIGVGTTTINDAYRMLVRYGIASNTQGGTFLTATAEQAACRYQISCKVRTVIMEARGLQLRDEEIIAVLLTELSANSVDRENETGTIGPDDTR